MKCVSFCLVPPSWETGTSPRAMGTFPLLEPQLSRGEIAGLEAPHLAVAGRLPGRAVSSAGCRTLCPPSDAKGRFIALELTLEVFPGAALLPRSAEANGCGHVQSRHTALLREEQNPITRAGFCFLGFLFTSQPPDRYPSIFISRITWYTYPSWRCSDCSCDLWNNTGCWSTKC